MDSIWVSLRSGSWLTPERLRAYPALLLAFQLLAIVVLLATSDGRHDLLGRPLGADFAQVWIAGTEVLGGHPERAFNLPAHLAEQRAFFGPATDVYGWHYPPYFLAIAVLLALLPYAMALAIWQLSTLPLYLAGVWGALSASGLSRRDVLVPALAFPAVFVNLTHGHNGFLTAGLFTGALLSLEKRPWLAGLLFACLVYKPQFGLVIPIALIAGRHWRVFAAATVSVIALTGLSIAGFGLESWKAFQGSLAFTRTVVLEDGNIGWEKIQSVFSAVRLLGGNVAQAYAMQTLVSALVLAAVAWLWHGAADFRLKAAALLCAALLTTPYSLDYDMVLLGPAIAFMAAHGIARGFTPFEKTILAATWIVPFVARIVAKVTDLPIGPMIMIAFFGLIVVRAVTERAIRSAEGSMARNAAA